ncbi:MAG: hypothetical protein GF329_09930, partial [Candidatus Lokiarchaeota archaeon]|nr:hypothetical protein [Candidatus Lokiarchaeota archaeon]
MENKYKKVYVLLIFISLIILIRFNYRLNSNLNAISRNENDINMEIGKESDWIIENYTIINNSFFYNGSIIVQNNGILEIQANLTINSSVEFENNITIKDNGTLILNNGNLNSTNSSNIYINNNASLLLYNDSLIKLNNIMLNSSNNITINSSNIVGNIIGNISWVIVNNSFLTSLKSNIIAKIRLTCFKAKLNNASMKLQGNNSYLEIKSSLCFFDSININLKAINTSHGGNTSIIFDINNSFSMNNSYILNQAGNSSITNAGDASITIKSINFLMINNSIYNLRGISNNSSYNNGTSYITFHGNDSLEGQNITLLNADGILHLNSSKNIIINNSNLTSNMVLSKNKLSSFILNGCYLQFNSSNSKNFINLTNKNVILSNSSLNYKKIHLNGSKKVLLDISRFSGSLTGYSKNISIQESSIIITKPINEDAILFLNSSIFEIENSIIELNGKNGNLYINSNYTFADNLTIDNRGIDGPMGGNANVLFNSSFIIFLNNTIIKNKGGTGMNDNNYSGIADIMIRSKSLKFINSKIVNQGGNKSGFDISGGLSNTSLIGFLKMEINNSEVRNHGGNSMIVPFSRGGNSKTFLQSEDFLLYNSTLKNFGGFTNYSSGGNAESVINAGILEGMISNLTNQGGNSKQRDNDNCITNISFLTNVGLYLYKMNINNIGGEGGSDDLGGGGNGGCSYMNFHFISNISNEFVLNNSMILNQGGNGGNNPYPLGESGKGGLSNMSIFTSNFCVLNGTNISNIGGIGGHSLIDTLNIRNAGDGGNSILLLSTSAFENINSIDLDNIIIRNLGGTGGDSYNLNGNGGSGGNSKLKIISSNLNLVNYTQIESSGGDGGDVLINNSYVGGIGGYCLFLLNNTNYGLINKSIMKLETGIAGTGYSGTNLNGTFYIKSSIKTSFVVKESEILLNEIIDFDNDNLSNIKELLIYMTNLFNNDTDYDRMPDGWEVYNGLNATYGLDNITDLDFDNLLNVYEYWNGTDPHNNDTDSDLLLDGDEILIYMSNPLDSDSDNDGIIDGYEIIIYGTDPNSRDTDMDLLNDWIDPIKTFPMEILLIILFIGVIAFVHINNFISLKNLRKEFKNQKEEIEQFFDFEEYELSIYSNKISIISKNLNKLLKYNMKDLNNLSDSEKSEHLHFYHRFIGIDQLNYEIIHHENKFKKKIKEYSTKYETLHFTIIYKKRILKILYKFNEIIRELDKIKWDLQDKLYNRIFDLKKSEQIKFKITDFEDLIRNLIKNWTEKNEQFEKNFDSLVENKEVSKINMGINELENIFIEGDKWVKEAIKWSNNLPLPDDVGYKHKLNEIISYYRDLKEKCMKKILKYRKELSISIEFVRNHISWNIEQLKKQIRDFEKNLFEDILRYLSSMITD